MKIVIKLFKPRPAGVFYCPRPMSAAPLLGDPGQHRPRLTKFEAALILDPDLISIEVAHEGLGMRPFDIP